MPNSPLRIGFGVPFYEAIRAAQQRGVVLPDVYYGELQGLARQQAFSIAGLASLDQLEQVRNSLAAGLQRGVSFNKWKKEMLENGILDLPAHRLDNIFRTNIQGNYNRGHWEKFQRNKKRRPYLMYDAINDSRVRPAHLALDGVIKPADDGFWATHAPLNGYRCRCRLISLTEKQAQARSGQDKGLNKPIKLSDMQPDKGWDYNPGEDLTKGIGQAIANKRGKTSAVILSSLTRKLPGLNVKNKPIAPYRQDWEEDFPKVLLNGPIGNAAKHPLYIAAKNGDLNASIELAYDLVTPALIAQIQDAIKDKKPILIPVHAEEKISINRIPLGYAVVLADNLGLHVDLNIVQSAKVGRTGADGFSRLAFPPPFSGAPNGSYKEAIIIDDTLTQGGTLANLRGYLSRFGIRTSLATTLTGKNYSSTLAITKETLNTMRGKYNELEHWWISYFGYGFQSLTESEARYLIKSGKDANAIRNRIITERQARLLQSDGQ